MQPNRPASRTDPIDPATTERAPSSPATADVTDPLAAPGAPVPVDHSASADRAAGGSRTRAGSDYGDYAPDRHASTVYIEAGLAAAGRPAGVDAGSQGLSGTPPEQDREGRRDVADSP